MSAALQRRLARLEQQQASTVHHHVVSWDEGEPEPQAQTGERLTIIRWIWSDEELSDTGVAAPLSDGGPKGRS